MSSAEDSFDPDINENLSRPLSSLTGRPSIHKECSGNCKSPRNHNNYSNHSSVCCESSEMVTKRSQSHGQLNLLESSTQEESRDEVDRAVRIHPQKARNKSESCPTTPSPQINKPPLPNTKKSKNNNSPHSLTTISNLSSTSESPVKRFATLKNKKIEDGSKDESSLLLWCSYFIILLALVLGAGANYFLNITKPHSEIYKTSALETEVMSRFKHFRTNLVEFRQRYNINSYTMSFLQNVVEQIWNDSSTSGFVFVYGRQCQGDLDETKALTFASEYAQIVANFMREDTDKPIQHIEVNSASLQMPTKGELIMKYEKELTKRGVLLLRRVEALSDTLAQDLHYYCDDVTPLVPKSAVLFTINMRSCGSCTMQDKNESTYEKPKQSVKKCLSDKWKNLRSSVLAPLLTRILNTVIDLDPILFGRQ